MKDIIKNILIVAMSVLIIYLYKEYTKTDIRIIKLEEAIIELHFRINEIKRSEYRKMFWTDTIVKTNYKTITITNYINEAEE